MSWVPLASDYSRHSRSARDAFTGTFVGYSLTQFACYALGLVALVTVADGDPNKIFGSFMAVPFGTLAFAVLAIRELDQSFADTYSTAVSLAEPAAAVGPAGGRARRRHAGDRVARWR